MQEDPTQSDRFAVATEQMRINPETLWDQQMPPGSIELNNPFAKHFRATKVQMPEPFSLPGTEYWQVEALNDYSREWPSFKQVDGKWQFRKGFLEPFDDPKVVPFFFYRGLEALKYSWGERAFQVAVAAAYTAVHVAIFGWFWQSNPALALAVGLNWGLGHLTVAKWGLLLLLASQERLWVYFAFLVAQQIDRAMAALFPPVRRFMWAMFTVWALFVVLSPAHYYPLPFAPFAPGTLGAQEALV